jgi:cytosine/adenosine deaminase-related metal-dependent hydrolase
MKHEKNAPAASLLIRNARAIVTVNDADEVLFNADIRIEAGVIKEIGPGLGDSENQTVIDASGRWIYPGLVNTHHHLCQTFTRNLPFVQNLELFPWLRRLYQIWRGIDDETIYYSALTGMGELLKYGCTTVMDHHYAYPRNRENHFVEQQFKAASELGLRMTAARGSMSRGEKDGGLPPDDLVQDVDVILEDCERLVTQFHDGSPFSFRQMVLAPCAPFNVTEDLLRETAVLGRRLGVRLHTHLCETKDEENYCLEKEGMRPLAYMEKCGWLGEDVWFAHGIYFTNDEISLLARTKTGVAHCPVSNMKLASGVCRVPQMLEKGVPLGLAVDGSASNDCSNLLAEIRAAYLLHRLSSAEKAPSGYEILKMATRGSAALLGRKDIGFLAPGMAADMFALDVEKLEFVGADLDPKNMPGVVGCSAPADWVMAGGRVIAKKGALCGIDEREMYLKASACVRALLDRTS